MKSIILDTETTGFPTKNPETQPHIIELGVIFVDDDNSIIRTISQLLNPGDKIWDAKQKEFISEIPAAASKVNGITMEMLIGKPTFKQFVPILAAFCTGADALIAHNARFDVKMLEIDLERSKMMGFEWPEQTICTMFEYKHLLSGKWPKLTELHEKIMMKPLKQTHRALDDCHAVYDILIEDRFFEKISETDNANKRKVSNDTE